MVSLRLLVNILVIIKINAVLGLYAGEQCTLEDNSKGICKLLLDCPEAFDLILHGKDPEKCGFEGTKVIVCCKGEQVSSVTREGTTTTDDQAIVFPNELPPPIQTPAKVPGDLSQRKCKEYAKYAYNKNDFTLSLLTHRSTVTECAFEKEKLIFGGTNAEQYEFPHMALIGYLKDPRSEEIFWSCGGSLISENFILTAAHCLNDTKFGEAKFVKIGFTNQEDLTNAQQIAVSEWIKYPEYVHTYHDIGLLKLERNADLNPYARPACIFTEERIPYERAIATGWGEIAYAGENSNHLLKIVLEFYSQEKCNKTYKKEIQEEDSNIKLGILYNIMICAGSSVDIRDTCQGDSGGPLQIYHDHAKDGAKCMYDVVGITSFGKVCGVDVNIPAVYTRVSAYVKWIEDTVWKDE